jgi:hypothetical protein
MTSHSDDGSSSRLDYRNELLPTVEFNCGGFGVFRRTRSTAWRETPSSLVYSSSLAAWYTELQRLASAAYISLAFPSQTVHDTVNLPG